MEKKTSVSLFGSCILRDTLFFHSDENYTVDRFVQTLNPVSAVQTEKVFGNADVSESQAFKTGSMSRKANFVRRNFLLDANKQVFDYLFGCKSDYLFMDVACSRMPVIHFKRNGKERFLTYPPQYIPTVNELVNEGYIPGDKLKLIKSDEELFPLVEKYLPVYTEKILEHYPVEKIVLLEIYPVRFYLNNNDISLFGDDRYRLFKCRISFCFEMTRKLLDGCHVIEFPDYVICDKRHKWGLDNMHYSAEFYDYVFAALNIIMRGNNDRITEERKLRKLKDEYSMLYYSRYEDMFTGKFRKLEKEVSLFTKYMNYFKDIASEPDKISSILNYFKDHGYHSCAFYGYTRIAQFYVDLFKKNNITIDYIIESSAKETVDGIPLIPRGSKSYPDTDVIIICDVNNSDNIEKSVRSVTDIPITNVYEIIK